MRSRGRLFAVGTDVYHPASGLGPLSYPVAEVSRLARLLEAGFTGDPLHGPSASMVRGALTAIEKSMPAGGPLLLYWAGHGLPRPGVGLKLYTSDSASRTGGLSVAELAELAAATGRTRSCLSSMRAIPVRVRSRPRR